MGNIFTLLKRISKAGTLNFFRNGWMSTATVSVLSITLFIILSLLMVSVLIETLVLDLKNRVDISVYFDKEVNEEVILDIRNDVLTMQEVKSAEYVSEDDALAVFREQFSENEIIIQSLDALEENPLEASLNIKAKDPNQFSQIAQFLEQEKYQKDISKLNYYENQEVIERLSGLITSIRKVGFTISLILIAVALMVSFNTIRITIYTIKGEIEVMKLVGASNWFVRGPLVVEGILYGIAASAITILLAFPILFFTAPYIENFFPGVNLFSYFKENISQIFFILLLVGVSIGALGSTVAIQKHLKV